MLRPEKAEAAQKALRTRCLLTVFAGAAFFLCAIAIFFIGVVLLIVAAVASARDASWRRGVAAGAIPPDSAFETFSLYLGMVVVAGLLDAYLLDAGAEPLASLSTLCLFAAPLLALWPATLGATLPAIRRAAGLNRGRGWSREALAGMAGYAAFFPVVVAATFASAGLAEALGRSLEGAEHPVAPMLAAGMSPARLAFMLFLVIIWAPFVEEIFFRGFLFAWLRSSLGVGAAVLCSSLVFAILHPQGLLGAPMLFALGAGFALIREWRGSLAPCVVAHALVNGITSVIILTL
jgi:membrane protease YdiL (CAAX protease family)